MTMEWLFGPAPTGEGWHSLQSRTLDIDCVVDVVRVLREFHSADFRAESLDDPDRASGEAAAIHAYEAAQAEERRLAREPRVILRGRSLEKVVALADVPGLSEHERRQIVVQGAGLEVEFRRGVRPTVYEPDTHFTDGRIEAVTDLIKGQGPRRVRAKPMLRFVPFLVAALGTACGVWGIVSEPLEAPLAFFVVAVSAGMWVTAIPAYLFLQGRYTNSWPGHRFREFSRSAFRERVTNGRAAALWAAATALVTIPGTAFLTSLFSAASDVAPTIAP